MLWTCGPWLLLCLACTVSNSNSRSFVHNIVLGLVLRSPLGALVPLSIGASLSILGLMLGFGVLGVARKCSAALCLTFVLLSPLSILVFGRLVHAAVRLLLHSWAIP